MNLFRFLKKCVTDPPAAVASAKLVARSFRYHVHAKLHPNEPLRYRLSTGTTLLLERGHSFTLCFWPAVERYEPEVRELLLSRLRPAMTFIDCGANIGYFSVLAAGIIGKEGRVLALEANPETYKLLQRNLDINGIGDAVHSAVGEESGEVTLYIPESGDVYSSVRTGGLFSEEEARAFKVQGRRLDDIVIEVGLARVDWIKIDVEGAEMGVLRSGRETLKKFRPHVVLEYGTATWGAFGAKPDDLLKLAGELRYDVKFFDPDQRAIVDLPANIWQQHYTNLVLVPQ